MPYLGDGLRGILMGSVYVVPGGDGGTVALVLGIYDRLIASLHAGASALGYLLRGRFGDARRRFGDVEWHFLLPLGVGIVIAAVTVASVIDRLLEDHPVATAATFVGLVLGAAVIAWRLVEHWTPTRYSVLAVTAAITFFALGFRPDEFTDPGILAFFGAGVVSLVALILPGFSGSTALITIGMYQPFLDAVTDRDLVAIGAFLVGGVLCLAAMSTMLDALLHSRHDTVVAALIGLMIGSLRALWPWQDESGAMSAPTDWAMPLLLAVAGFVVVAGAGWWAQKAPGTRHQAPAKPDSEAS
ncbi:MAG: DUF368 domain-containing protein [Actinomycetota bacterium]